MEEGSHSDVDFAMVLRQRLVLFITPCSSYASCSALFPFLGFCFFYMFFRHLFLELRVEFCALS